MQRPTGITILAVLAAIGGVLGLLTVLGALPAMGVLGFGFTLLVLVTLALSILALAFAYGAWTLKPWAWTLGVANYVISHQFSHSGHCWLGNHWWCTPQHYHCGADSVLLEYARGQTRIWAELGFSYSVNHRGEQAVRPYG